MDSLATLAIVIPWLLLIVFLPKYLQQKAKNLATKEDIRDITDKVEAVKADYAKQVERFRHETALWEKRRDISAQVVDLINHYKALPADTADPELRALEAEYYKLIPWIPTGILRALNSLFDQPKPGVEKPDVKDVLIAVRQAILNAESGDFKGVDLVHFVGFANQRK